MATPAALARGLLLFWALWLSVVTASNAVDALQAAGVLAPGSTFASGNFALVAETLTIYSLPQACAAVLFALVLLLEGAASALFGRAALDPQPPKVIAAFLVAIGLFCAFLVFDEVLLVYRRFPNLETTHFTVLGALLLSWLVIHQLREREGIA